MFSYSPIVRAYSGPYYGAALVGTYSAVIGWNFDDPALREGLLGFAVRRIERENATGDLIEDRWLSGYKRFVAIDGTASGEFSSLQAPYQRFRWNDYTLDPMRSYRYEVHPMRGIPGSLTRNEEPLVFEFSPTVEDDGVLGIYVNRGVSAAKAYYDRFGDVDPNEVTPEGAAFDWLSRGLRESLVGFIKSAQPGDDLHLAVYEFFDHDIAHALHQLAGRGVKVRIVHDAKKDKKSTKESREVVHASKLGELVGVVVERTTVNISHNKLAIHLSNGAPVKAWAGTANLSQNGFHYQTNNAIVLRDPDVVQAYEDYFQNLTGNPSKALSKDFNIDLMGKINMADDRLAAKTFFSPIRKEEIVEAAADLIGSAKSMVLISAPFGVHKDMKLAMGDNNADALEFGLANSTAKNKIKDLRRRQTQFYPPHKLKTFRKERWDAKAFGAHKIHTKAIVVDPYGDNPRVLTGSANFSRPSCVDNDENALLIESNKRLAAVYATEFMRMYDHYKSRFYIARTERENASIRKENKLRKEQGKAPLNEKSIPVDLKSDKSWSKTAFDKNSSSHKYADRIAFSGTHA